MAKLGCICGATIVDQAMDLPYKAKFMRDQDQQHYWDYSDAVGAFIEAIKEGKREAWIRSYFSETYPVDISDSSVVFDIVSNHELKYTGDIYQCSHCGRILVQIRDTDRFASFKPEDDRYPDIFKGFKE